MKIKDGFAGERSIVVPKMIIDALEQDPQGSVLHVTDIGYYPGAKHHYRERLEGINQYVFIYCVKGKGWYQLGASYHQVEAGQFFILPAGEPHSYGAHPDEPWTIYWMHFKGSLASFYSQGLHLPHDITMTNDSRIHDRIDLFEEIFYSIKAGYNRENLAYAHALLHHFLGSLRYISQFRKAGASAAPLSDADIAQNAIRYMKEHLEHHVTLADIAEYVGYSCAHFSMLFRKAIGHSPLSYFNLLKIQAACAMLDSTDIKINQVALKLGFSDTLYFSRLFHKIMGVSPRAYRQQDRG